MTKKPSRMTTCPHCDGRVVATKREHTCEVGGTTFVARVASYSCRACGSVFLAGDALHAIDVEIACTLARMARPDGDTLRFLRKALGMRALELASLLQVTAETVSRWERGQRSVDLHAWMTVGSLVLEESGRSPMTLERLERLAARSKMPRSITIDLDGSRRYRLKVTRGSSVRRTQLPDVHASAPLKTATGR